MEEHHCCRDRDNKFRPEDVIYVVAYDVSYADGAQNAKCAAAVIKLTKQAGFLKRDKYLKQIVWLQDWRPTDHMLQAKRLKELWAKFTYEGSQTYIAIDAWQYGTAVLTDLMGDLQDGLAPLCVYKHKSFTEFELEGAVPIIYPIRAGGNGLRIRRVHAFHQIQDLPPHPKRSARRRYLYAVPRDGKAGRPDTKPESGPVRHGHERKADIKPDPARLLERRQVRYAGGANPRNGVFAEAEAEKRLGRSACEIQG